MKKNFLTMFLIVVLIITGVTMVIANPGGAARHRQNPGSNPLAQIDLSVEQTEQIRKLRLAHEKSIAPLKIEEHQLKAELDIFWLQMTPDVKKIKSAQKKNHELRLKILEKDTDFRIALREVLTEEQISRFLALGGDQRQSPERFGHRPPHPQQPKRY